MLRGISLLGRSSVRASVQKPRVTNALSRKKTSFTRFPPNKGLYDSSLEKDSCGVGLVAHLKKTASRQIVLDANEMLVRMSHRGACGCEANSGDGAGDRKYLKKSKALNSDIYILKLKKLTVDYHTSPTMYRHPCWHARQFLSPQSF